MPTSQGSSDSDPPLQSATTTTSESAHNVQLSSRRIHVVFGSPQPRSLTGVLASHSRSTTTSPFASSTRSIIHSASTAHALLPTRADDAHSGHVPIFFTGTHQGVLRERNRTSLSQIVNTSEAAPPQRVTTVAPYRGNPAKTMVWPRRMRPPPRSNWEEYSSGSSISSTSSSRSVHSSKHSVHSHRTGSSAGSREATTGGAHRIPAPVLHALHPRRPSMSSRVSAGSSSSRHSHGSSHESASGSPLAKGKKPSKSKATADSSPKPSQPPRVRATRYLGTPPPGTFATSPDAPSRLLANRAPTPKQGETASERPRAKREPVDLLAAKFLSMDTA